MSSLKTGLSFESFVANASRDYEKHRLGYLFFVQNLIGVEVEITLLDGKCFKGIFHIATVAGEDMKIVVKCCKRVNGKPNDFGVEASTGDDLGATMIIAFDQIKQLHAPGHDFHSRFISANGTGKDLQTDSAVLKKEGISKKELLSKLDGRELQSIGNSWLDPSTSTASLESGKKAGNTAWDQFEVNKRLFNSSVTYDENLYTKKLDRSALTKDQILYAEKMAKEIEGSTSTNIHLQEERGQLQAADYDEEDLYSGVIRGNKGKSNNNKAGGKQAQAEGNANGPWRRNQSGGSSVSTISGSTSPAHASGSQPESPLPEKTKVPDAPPGLKLPPSEPVASPSPAPVPAPTPAPPAEVKPEEKKQEPAVDASKTADNKPKKGLNAFAVEFVPGAMPPRIPFAQPGAPMMQQPPMYPPNDMGYPVEYGGPMGNGFYGQPMPFMPPPMRGFNPPDQFYGDPKMPPREFEEGTNDQKPDFPPLGEGDNQGFPQQGHGRQPMRPYGNMPPQAPYPGDDAHGYMMPPNMMMMHGMPPNGMPPMMPPNMPRGPMHGGPMPYGGRPGYGGPQGHDMNNNYFQGKPFKGGYRKGGYPNKAGRGQYGGQGHGEGGYDASGGVHDEGDGMK